MCWCCENPEGDYLREVVEPIIERSGWMVQAVSGRPRLSYTVGLTARSLPELVVTGLAAREALQLLNAVAGGPVEALQHGSCISVGERVIEVVELPHPDAHLHTAVGMYGPGLRAIQLVWADDRGHWPWCRGHRVGRGGQPVLGPRVRPQPLAG